MNINRIMCPVDFSRGSRAALEYASRLASESGATLDLVHVNEDYVEYIPGYGGYGYLPSADHLRELREREWLNRLVPAAPVVRCLRHYLQGPAAKLLVEFADRERVDLIVMGTHGRSGLRRLAVGSVAETVLRRASCPVLVVKRKADEEAENPAESLRSPERSAR